MDAWWIDRPWVLGSDNPTTEDLDDLRRKGFEVLISLLQEDKQPPNYDVETIEQETVLEEFAVRCSTLTRKER